MVILYTFIHSVLCFDDIQISSREGLRKFYAAYYWCWKFGEMLSGIAYTIFMQKQSLLTTASGNELLFKSALLGWCAFSIVLITLAMACLFVGKLSVSVQIMVIDNYLQR